MTEQGFKVRLMRACDESPHVPELGRGRQVYLAKSLGVTQEAVRKWLVGESLPRPEKVRVLAKFLNVDHTWLSLGTSPLETSQKRQVAQRADAAVYGVMSYLMLAGYNVAIPPADSNIDIYAIKHGTQLAVAVSMGESLAPDTWRVTFPTTVDARFYAVIASDEETLHLDIFDISPVLALAVGQRTGSGVDLTIEKDRKNGFVLGGTALRRLGSPWTER
jgi:hypothetical protein